MKLLISLLFFSAIFAGTIALAQTETAAATEDKTPGTGEAAADAVLSPGAINGHFWQNGVGTLSGQQAPYQESKSLDMTEEHCRGLITGFDPGTLNDPPTEAAVAPTTGGGSKRDN
jgi:hypothetical protein